MSERTPLIDPRTRRQAENAIPSKSQRIKVAETIGALQAGKLPSQDQLSKLIQLVLDSDTLKTSGGANSKTARLGTEGQKVLEDTKNVLRALKAWGDEKNGDDLIQNFFYNAATADVNVDINTASAPSQKELSKDAQRAISSLRSIASLMITNPVFRQLGSDGILLTRDIFADAASVAADLAKNASEAARPSEKERKDGVDFEQAKAKGKEVAKKVQSGKAQGQAKQGLFDEVEKVKEYFDEKLPEGEEARERTITKLQEVVTQAQQNPEYRRAITSIINLFKKYTHKAQDALDETKKKSDISDEDEKVQQAGRDLRAFVEKVSGKSIDDLISAAQKVGEDVKGNEKLSIYFDELEQFIERLLYQPGYVTSQRAYKRASAFYDDGQSLLAENDQWKEDAGKLQKELEALVNGITNDKATLRLVNALENLGSSLASAGQVGFGSLKAEGQGLYRDFLDVIVPRLIALVKEIPVPRVEFKSEDVDIVIDDIKLESASFIPDSIRVVQKNDLRFTQGYATYASEYDGSLRLRVDGLHFSASNIAFWIAKKSGFMPYEDAGLLDLTFGSNGISFDTTLENATEEDRETFFTVKDVAVSISDFDFKVRDNDQWLATWFAKPILKAFVKRNLTHALEAQIAEYLRQADFRAYGLQQRAIAATNAKPSPANWVNAIVRDSIFPQSSDHGPVKVRQAGVVKYGRRGEYVLHVGVDDHLFPDQPPARVSNKQREKAKALAGSGSRQAKGAADQFKNKAQNAKEQGKQEANELDARRKEQARRENKEEGWRSKSFDV